MPIYAREYLNKRQFVKGQLISNLVSSISSKKQTETRRIVVKTNSFVRFLEEFMA